MSEMRTKHGIVFAVVGLKKPGNGSPFKMYKIELPAGSKPIEAGQQDEQLPLVMNAKQKNLGEVERAD
jgi:hypothetical protein